MAETELQGLVEQMKFTSEKLAEDRARHFEEQKLHSQNMEKQILEMKEILISMAARHRVQASSSKDPAQNSPSTPVSQFHSTRGERIAVKKLPDQVAHQVFDETSKSEKTIENDGAESMEQEESNRVESSEDGDEGLIEEVLEIDGDLSQDLAARQVLDEMSKPKESSDSTVHHVLEEMPKPTKTIEVIGVLTKDDDDDDLLEMASWIEADFEPPTYTKGYMKLMCFDPGGNFAGVLLEMHIVDYDLSYYCHLNSIELIRWPAKLNLERSDFGFKTLIPTWSSLLISVELFIFDPGGMIISSASSVMPLVHKTLQEWSIEVRIAGKIATFGHKRVIHVGEVTAKLLYLKNGINGVYYSALYNDMSRYVCCAGYRGASSGIVFKKTYISVWKEALNPTLASVAYVLKFKFDVLIKLEMDASYLLNHLGLLATGCGNLTFTWKYIYICIETFIFDPGGSWFLHSELKVTIARLILDPGGQCSRFTETGSFVSCLLWLCNQGYELIIKNSSQEQYFCLILGDKDHLKEGVLLQDFGN